MNRTILEDLEEKATALRQKLGDRDAGVSFGDWVARSRPVGLRSECLGYLAREVRARIPSA